MELGKHIENSFIDAIKDKRFTDAESFIPTKLSLDTFKRKIA